MLAPEVQEAEKDQSEPRCEGTLVLLEVSSPSTTSLSLFPLLTLYRQQHLLSSLSSFILSLNKSEGCCP